MPVIKKSIFIDAPTEKAYHFSKNVKYWGCWYAGLSDPENLVGDGGIGTVYEAKFSLMGHIFPIKLEIIEDNFTSEIAIEKWIFEGTVNTTQKSTFVPKGNGTEVTFEIDLNLPEMVDENPINNEYLFLKTRENLLACALENLRDFVEFHYGPKS